MVHLESNAYNHIVNPKQQSLTFHLIFFSMSLCFTKRILNHFFINAKLFVCFQLLRTHRQKKLDYVSQMHLRYFEMKQKSNSRSNYRSYATDMYNVHDAIVKYLSFIRLDYRKLCALSIFVHLIRSHSVECSFPLLFIPYLTSLHINFLHFTLHFAVFTYYALRIRSFIVP